MQEDEQRETLEAKEAEQRKILEEKEAEQRKTLCLAIFFVST